MIGNKDYAFSLLIVITTYLSFVIEEFEHNKNEMA